MLRLLTFGGLVLETDSGVPVGRLRRPWLAMLAVIAAAGERGVPRERLIALFWPDSDEERARHSARQVLYGLRQELGGDVIRSTGTTLSLDPAAITSDIGDFRAALARGDREQAVGFSRGPFLEAFYLTGSAAFERWMEEERGRLTTATTTALLALATDAVRTNNRDASVEWWRKLTVLDPLNGRFAVGFLKALAARGDRAEALAFARQHELVMRRELEAEPDPDVQRIEAQLRAMRLIAPATNGAHPEAPSPPTTPSPSEAQTPAVVPALTPVESLPDAAPGTARRWAVKRVSAVAGAAAMLLVIVTAAFARQLGWLTPASDGPTFAVGLIREEGVPDSARNGRVLTDMVATDLARVDGLRILANSRLLELMRPGGDSAAGYSDAARRAGATELFEGHVRGGSGTDLVLEIRRVELRTGLVKDVYRVSAADRYALVDSMTQVISGELRLMSPSGSIADATTNSLVAYRLYEEGLRAFYQGDVPSAQRLMRAALVEDSLFAIAAWHEAQMVGQSGLTVDGRPVNAVRRTALRLAQRAPPRERLIITANLLVDNHDPGAVAAAESLTTSYPDDPRALMTLARAQGASGNWARAVAANERAIALDSMAEDRGTSVCRVCDDFYHLTELYSLWDSLPAAQRTARRYQAIRPKHGAPFAFLALAAARLGDSASAYASYRVLTAVGTISPHFKSALDLTLEQYDVVESEVRPFLGSAAMSDWGNGAWTYFIALRNQGRMREAIAFSRDGWIPGLPPLRFERAPVANHEGILALETGNARNAVQWFQRLPSAAQMSDLAPGVIARNLSWRGTLIGMALAAAGDTARLRAMADSVEQWGRGSAYGRDQKSHHYLRGMLEVAAGRDEEAVRRFRAAIHSPTLGFTRVNYELGRAQLRLDRPQEAVLALQPALRGAVDASNLYLSRTELHELLADAFDRAGQRDSAAVHYRAVVNAWQRADPMFHERRDRASGWLARHAPVRVARR